MVDMVADMEVDKVDYMEADMEVDKVADNKRKCFPGLCIS